jgi:hypothetical protein
MPSFSICVRMRTPSGVSPPEVDDVGLELTDPRELGGEVLLVGGDAEGADDGATVLLEELAEVFVVALAVVRGVVDHGPLLVAQAGHELRRDVVLVDHRAVDAMDLLEVVGVGDVGQHRAPHHGGHAEAVVHAGGGHRHRGAVVRDAGDDAAVRRDLGGDLHAHVRLAFVVLGDQLVRVLRLRVGIAQPDGQVRRIAATQADVRVTAGERTDEGDLDHVLGHGRRGQEQRRAGGGDTGENGSPRGHACFPFQ